MQSLKVLLLICSAGTPRAECSMETALDIISGPTEAGCGMMAQAYVAGTAIGQRMSAAEYLKVICRGDDPARVHKVENARGRASLYDHANQAQNGYIEGQLAATSFQPLPRHYTISE